MPDNLSQRQFIALFGLRDYLAPAEFGIRTTLSEAGRGTHEISSGWKIREAVARNQSIRFSTPSAFESATGIG